MTLKISALNNQNSYYTKLVSLSVTVAMTLGLVVNIPKEVVGQTQPTPSVQQSEAEALEEIKHLNRKSSQLIKEGKYIQVTPLLERKLLIVEKLLGKEHPFVSILLSELGLMYYQQRNYVKFESLLKRLLTKIDKLSAKKYPIVIASLLDNLALVYHSQGKDKKAESLYQRALAIKEKVLGKEHPKIATTLYFLGSLYYNQGSYQRAEPLFERLLIIEEKELGKEHPDLAYYLQGLAQIYNGQKKYEKAEQLFERALTIKKKALGEEHSEVAHYFRNLGIFYHNQESYHKAEPFLQRALLIKEKALGKKHLGVAYSLEDLARLYKSQYRYKEAEHFYKRALAIKEKVLGKEHSSVANSLQKLAVLYYEQGNYKKIESLLKRVLTIYEEAIGKENAYVARTFIVLAQFYKEQGHYKEAETLFKRSLAMYEKMWGKEHPALAPSLLALGAIYQEQGSHKKAEQLFKRSLTITEKAMGEGHPIVADSLYALMVSYHSQGSYKKAEQLFKRLLTIEDKKQGKEHPDLAKSFRMLGTAAYLQEGNYQKAEQLLKRSLAINEKFLGKEHLEVAKSLKELGIMYFLEGSYEKAEPLLKRSLAIREKTLGKEHPDVAESLNGLGLMYFLEGSYGKAEPLLKRSLAIREKTLGKEHPKVAKSLKELGLTYLGKDHITRATNFFRRQLEVEEQNLKLIFAVGSEKRKQNYANTFVATTNEIVSISLEKAHNNSTLGQLALTTVLRRKGRVLDAVADSAQILRSQLKNNTQAKQLFDEWLDVQQQLSALIYKDIGKQTFEGYKARYKQLEARREELEAAISSKSAEFRTEFEPVELAAIQAKIPKDAALIEIVQYGSYNVATKKWSKPRYAAAILRNQGQPKWVDLGEAAAINKSVTELRRALKSKISNSPSNSSENHGIIKKVVIDQQKSLQELARNLDKQVMAPLRPHLGNARHLLLSPDGELTLIPFEALQDEKGKYLVENYSFSYLTSGRDLLKFDSSAPANSTPVVFADIDYDEQQNNDETDTRGSQNRRSTDLATMKFNPLAATLEEAQKIKSIFSNTKIILNKQATETAIKQLQAPGILHLATHGFFLSDVEVDLPKPDMGLMTNKFAKLPRKMQLENPLLRSGIALAGFNNRQKAPANTNDGVLTALEVAGLNLRGTQLVVLSACETGLGDVEVGEGLYGLRRALAIAGSQSQVLSLWKVSDAGTKDLMVEYYSKLKAGKGRHEALREVQLEFIKHPKYKHPYYWASFLPSGNWTPLDKNLRDDK